MTQKRNNPQPKNYYTFSLSNTKSELEPTQFSKAVYFTIHLVRVRSKDIELDTIHIGTGLNAFEKQDFINLIIENLNNDLENRREEKRKPKPPITGGPTTPPKPKPKPKPKPPITGGPTTPPKPKEEKPTKDGRRRAPVRSHYDEDEMTYVKTKERKLRAKVTINNLRDFDFILLRKTTSKITKVRKIINATHVKIIYGEPNEGYRDLEIREIPKSHLGNKSKIEELVNDIYDFKRQEFDDVLNYYGTIYFTKGEDIIINDVIFFEEHIILDIYKGMTNFKKIGNDYYLRKVYWFYHDGVELTNPLSKNNREIEAVFHKRKKKLIKDYKKLADYMFKVRVSSAYIYRALYSMDTYANTGDDVFVAQGVGIGRVLNDTSKKYMHDSVTETIDALLLKSGDTTYLERFKNVYCDGFCIENDSRDLSELDEIGSFKMFH